MHYIFLILALVSLPLYAQLPNAWEEVYRDLSDKNNPKKVIVSIDSVLQNFNGKEYFAQIAYGIAYTELGDFTKAQQYYNRAKSSLSNDSNIFMRVSLYHNRAIMYKRQSNYISAQQNLEKAKEYLHQLATPSCSLSTILWNDYGVVCKRLGQNEQALYYFQKSLQYKSQCNDLPPISRYITLNNIAGTYMAMDQFNQADSLYQYVYHEKINKFGFSHPTTLIAMHNLAVLYKQQKRYPEAEYLLKQVLEKKRTILLPPMPIVYIH